jgi:hypothetical protein
MIHVWPIYGALLTAVLIRAWFADPRLFAAAGVLAVDWLASNFSRWFAPFDYRLMFQPSDLTFAFLFLMAWTYWRRPWMAVISALYAISGFTGLAAYGPGSKYTYDLALNAAFLARLAVVWIASSEPRKIRERT